MLITKDDNDMVKFQNREVVEFLLESNAIERVYDFDSLVQAMAAWNFLIERTKITPAIILKTHKMLMKNQDLEPKYKGAFRDIPVYIGGRIGLESSQIPEYIADWCGQVNRGEIDSMAAHKVYEAIHPFADGNGRTGRMFMNWQRLTKTKEPLWIIHEGMEQMEYYKMFL